MCITSASKVFVGAVCLPKYCTPAVPAPPSHLVHAVYLYSLFLKHTQVPVHTVARSLTCSPLQVGCSQSGTRGGVQPPCSLICKHSRMSACTAQAHKHPHLRVSVCVRSGTQAPCTRAQEVQVHRTCVLVRELQVQTCFLKSAPAHTCARTRVRAGTHTRMLGGSGI